MKGLIALACLTLLAYAGVWTAGWVYDDTVWAPVLSGYSPWRLATLVGTGQPWAYHGLVVLVHMLNGYLLYAVSRRYLASTGALVAVGLFWLHPIQTEAVAYVSGGIEVLLTSIVLTTILVARRGGVIGIVGGLLGLYLAVSMKPSALPLLLVLPAVWLKESKRTWIAWPAVLGLIAASTVTWEWLLRTPGDVEARMASAGRVIGALGQLSVALVWPARLSLEHDWSALGAPAVASTLLAVLLTWTAIAIWSLRTKGAAVGWAGLWIGALILPRALIPNAPPLLEHHLYLPLVSIWLLAGWATDRVWQPAQTFGLGYGDTEVTCG